MQAEKARLAQQRAREPGTNHCNTAGGVCLPAEPDALPPPLASQADAAHAGELVAELMDPAGATRARLQKKAAAKLDLPSFGGQKKSTTAGALPSFGGQKKTAL